ncbi:Hypothetical protein R9X50_00033900 [Acrodontium crateriforme]|uniref:Fibroin-3 related protein n=1 Tax=Acrodontium crateriforme TaxID=150365 RepID=A0AAQ3M045_9PEZI|nr:Hypothetical protein R9X50_00033900 [Acrodontium crateriforme]
MSALLWGRDIVGEANDVKTTFSSWDSCMSKSYCKWPVIAVIIVVSLIVFSIVWSIARCLCCGLECCCGCLACCNACCPSPRRKRNEGYQQAPPSRTGDQPSNYWAQYATHPKPVYGSDGPAGAASGGYRGPSTATFDVPTRKGPGYNEDALPAMPSWNNATSKHVMEEVELEEQPPAHQKESLLAKPDTGNGGYAGSQQGSSEHVGAIRANSPYHDTNSPQPTRPDYQQQRSDFGRGQQLSPTNGQPQGRYGQNMQSRAYGQQPPGAAGYGQLQQRSPTYDQRQQQSPYGQRQQPSPLQGPPQQQSPSFDQRSPTYGQPHQSSPVYGRLPQNQSFNQAQERSTYDQHPQLSPVHGQAQAPSFPDESHYQPNQGVRDNYNQHEQHDASPLPPAGSTVYSPTYSSNSPPPPSATYQSVQPFAPHQPHDDAPWPSNQTAYAPSVAPSYHTNAPDVTSPVSTSPPPQLMPGGMQRRPVGS